ncbi:MAG: hypothetical protein ABIQ55_03350 [Gemmatimonadaceae bacterium]
MLMKSHRALFVAALILIPLHALAAQGTLKVSGIHANEPFCKTMIKQFEVMTTYTRSGLGLTDPLTKKKYFADQKVLNATLVKTAPASLATDVALLSRNANLAYDAQMGTDRKAAMAALAPLRRPEHLAAAKRANAYCGLNLTK